MKSNKFKYLQILILLILYFSIITSSKNLYKKTLRRKLSSSSRFIAETRRARQDDDIPDPIVIYDIALTAHSKDHVSCPYPFEVAKSNCKDNSCDFNEGKKFNWVYLCIAKKKLSLLTPQETIINKILVKVNNNDCGKLKSVSLQKDRVEANYRFINICYGNDPEFPPLKSITVYHKKTEKEIIPPNCIYEIVWNKFMCTEVELKAPKKIEFSNLTIRPQTKNFKKLGNSDIITEIENDNSKKTKKDSIIRKIVYSKFRTSTWNMENKFFSKIPTTYIGQIPLISVFNPNISFNIEFNSSRDLGEMTNDILTQEIDFDCYSPPGKHYKCRATTNKYSANIPYYLDRTIHFYDGTQKIKRIDSKFQGVLTSSIELERCCYGKNCDLKKENICLGDLKKETGYCPKLEDSIQYKPNKEFKPDILKLEPELDGKVITDIKMIIGLNTSCSKGYEFVLAMNPKDNTKVGKTLKFETNFNKEKYFMCVKKENISQIKHYDIINAIRLNKRNEDCGILNSIKMNANESSQEQICYGFDGDRGLYPISEVMFAREKDVKMANSRSYICDDISMNKFRLCYKVFRNATKRMGLRNFEYNYELSKKMQTGPPNIISEVQSSSMKISAVAKSFIRRQSFINKIIHLGSGITFDSTRTYEADSTNLQGKVKEHSNNKYESVSFVCNGPEPRKFKCIASVFSYRIFVPYTADLVHYDYQGKEIHKVTKRINGVSDDLLTSGIRINKCCVSNCCTGFEKKNGPRPWCVVNNKAIKDIICSKLERCYNEFPLIAKKGEYW